MAFCRECGKELAGGAVFCGNCGFAVNRPAGVVASGPVPPPRRKSPPTVWIVLGVGFLFVVIIGPIIAAVAIPLYFSYVNQAKISTAPPVVEAFERAFLAALAESDKDLSELGAEDVPFDVPESDWWAYTIVPGGRFIAVLKERTGRAAAGDGISTVYDAERGCFVRAVDSEVYEMMSVDFDNGCR